MAIDAETVVLACGMYTTEVAALAGVNVPIVPMAHQYVVTKPIDGVTDRLPQLRDPDNLVYFRRESGGLVFGGYERDPAPWSLHGVPADFNNKLLPEDWDRFAPLFENAITRVPAVEHVEIVRLVNGPEGFTPDNEFVLGETEVHGLFVAAGFCAHGIAGAGGVGRAISEWIVEGQPSFDTWAMDIRRFGAQYRSRDFTLARAVEVYSTYYDIHYPNEERHAGRPLRRSPAYERLAALGCAFGEKSSWERPNWFEPHAAEGDESLRPRGWAGQHWSPAIGVEALACRDAVVLFDETSFSKMELSGPGVAAFLDRVCANDMSRPVGAVTYTQLCNERGGIECDLTATRIADDRYFVVTGTAFGNHDLGWVRKQRESSRRARASRRSTRRPGSRASASGDLGPATCWRRRPRHRSTTTRSRTSGRARSASVRCRASPCASRTSASSAGSSTARPSTAERSGTRCGRRASRTACAPAATGRSTHSTSRRATASGRRTSRPTTRPTRPGSASRSGSTRRATSSGATHSSGSRRTGPPDGSAASSSTTRAR